MPGIPVPVQTGGGVRSLDAVDERFALGAERVVIGTAALEQPELLERASQRYPGRVILGLDARGGRVATRGWAETSSERVEASSPATFSNPRSP